MSEKYDIILGSPDIINMSLEIIGETVDYVRANNIDTLVLGISGGVDSALVAALASEVCTRLNNKVKLYGRIIPINSNDVEMARAIEIANCFCDNYKIIDLSQCFVQMMEWIETPSMIGNYFSSEHDMRVRLGNIKARLRMIQLYHVAHSLHGMVLSTDNYTEYLLGFWTLHGDVGDYGMIQHLWKSEVYAMAQCIDTVVEFDYTRVNAMNACVDAIPTDGLGITKSDLEQFDANSYSQVDRILYKYLYGEPPDNWELKIPKVVQMYKATHHKRINPISIPRNAILGYKEDE